ncbi:MFS transporter [Gemmobacter aquaticus]|uniref:MFS transporter n=1 Tax=Gemmobacter aquaticus TaxID=490185 RepID=A0A918DC69_9RHOB|nr:MFS transporter [Gemmobacter aquaticus]GGO28888.1 MFS transporter [Gemmobacter aquaticus]
MSSPQKGRVAVASLFLVNGAIMGAWAPQIPQILPRHGIQEAVMGLLLLGLGLGAVSAMLFAGRLIHRFGSVRVVLGFALAMIAVFPLVALAPTLPTLALSMFALGAAAGCMDVAMNANAVEVERALGRAIMSSSHGFWSLGGFAGAALGGWLIAATGAVTQAVLVSVALALIIALAVPFLYHAPKTPEAEGGEAPRPSVLPRSPRVWLLGLTALLCMTPEGAIMDWSALYLIDDLGIGTGAAGLGFALFSGAMATMRFAGDAVRNRFGAVRTLRVSALVAAVAMIAASLAPTPDLAMLAFAVAGLGIANTVPILFSAAGNLQGMSPGAGLATVTMVGYAGILVAPSTIGYIAEHAGFRFTWAGLALCLIVVASLARLARDADLIRR